MTPRLLPLFVSVEGLDVVVTGDGPTARAIVARLEALRARVRRAQDAPDAPALDGAALLVAASDDAAADAAILAAARARGTLAVSAIGPEGHAFLGACEQRDGLAVAVTSCGQSPELEARLVAEASRVVAPHHPRLAGILGAIRAKLESRIADEATRDDIWQQILDSPVTVLLEAGQDDEALEMAERMAWGTG